MPRTHLAQLTAGQVTALNSAPSTADHGIEAPQGSDTIVWHLTGATAGTFYYYDGVSWKAGKTFTISTDGNVVAQLTTGTRVAVHITGGTLTAGSYELRSNQ